MTDSLPDEIWAQKRDHPMNQDPWFDSFSNEATKYIIYDEYENLKHDLDRYMDIANGYINGEAFQAIEQENFALQKTIRELAEALDFYKNSFKCKINKSGPTGLGGGITYHATEELMSDCGNKAITTLKESAPRIVEAQEKKS